MLKQITKLAKVISKLSKRLGKGSGNTWPGYIALKLYPKLLADLLPKLPSKIVLVTGTNGKTTTAKLISHILTTQGFRVLHNTSGANLLNGIVSTLLVSINRQMSFDYDVVVLEVDEFFFPQLLSLLDTYCFDSEVLSPPPPVCVCTLLNLSRDQLDRYFEPDIILDKWQTSLNDLSFSPRIIYDGTQLPFQGFGFKQGLMATPFFPTPVELKRTPLVGDFNAHNLSAALSGVGVLGVSSEPALQALATFELAYGRGELILYGDTSFRVFLAKNPASFNCNLNVLASGAVSADALLLVLNDNIPDGRDISWIYDIAPILLKNSCTNTLVLVAGSRALEMALRLQYAGVSVPSTRIFSSLQSAVAELSADSDIKNVMAFPNYSAMLQLRKLLSGRAIL
jgi:lipid II isoglutaminyl synthase (glutamine-hydrolysing)